VLLFCAASSETRSRTSKARGGVLSEFYAQRRTSIKDGVGLVAFILGWFVSAPFAWPYIAAGFDDGGNAATGVLKFVLVVFAAGLVFGALGLLVGAAAGMVWERFHRYRRSTRTPAAEQTDESGSRATPTDAASRVPRIPLPALRYETSVAVSDYLALLHLVSREDHDVERATSAFARTTNIGAWHDDRLVGVARVLSDGYFFAALADIVVDPEYQRRGMGRQLMNRAYDTTPRGTLFVNARTGSAAFFDRIGCERGVAGFVMRRAATMRDVATIHNTES
jgi:GNAT superfamily N-acetyltransferase